MRVVVVTPPAPVVSVQDAKDHLRMDSDDQDFLIETLVAAATAHIDGPDGWLGRAIGLQTLELRDDAFGCGGDLRLPYPPVVSVVSVSFVDPAGVVQTLADTAYEVRGAQLVPAWSTSWPAYRATGEGVRVRYTAGYAVLPSAIRAAILLMVGDLYANRESSVSGTINTAISMPTTLHALLSPFRVWA